MRKCDCFRRSGMGQQDLFGDCPPMQSALIGLQYGLVSRHIECLLEDNSYA